MKEDEYSLSKCIQLVVGLYFVCHWLKYFEYVGFLMIHSCGNLVSFTFGVGIWFDMAICDCSSSMYYHFIFTCQ